MKILVVGANNSDKKLLINLIANKTGLDVIGCSNILRECGFDITTGKLVPDYNVNQVMSDTRYGDAFILDGYPRTLPQNQYMLENLFSPDLVIVLNISEEEAINRSGSIRICPVCKNIYNLNGSGLSINTNLCDKCQAELIQREDDKEEVVRARFQEYLEYTYPIINYYKYVTKKTIVWEFDATEDYNEIATAVADYIRYMLYD